MPIYYRVYDEGLEWLWHRKFRTKEYADQAVARAFRKDAFGNIMDNVVGPLLILREESQTEAECNCQCPKHCPKR